MSDRTSEEVAAEIEEWIEKFGADKLQGALDRLSATNELPSDPALARAVASIARSAKSILAFEGFESCHVN